MDYLTKPFNVEEVHIVVANTLANSKLREEVDYLRRSGLACVEGQIVGESPAMRDLLQKVEMFARARTGGLAATSTWASMPPSSPPPTATSKRRWRVASSARISTTG